MELKRSRMPLAICQLCLRLLKPVPYSPDYWTADQIENSIENALADTKAHLILDLLVRAIKREIPELLKRGVTVAGHRYNQT